MICGLYGHNNIKYILDYWKVINTSVQLKFYFLISDKYKLIFTVKMLLINNLHIVPI